MRCFAVNGDTKCIKTECSYMIPSALWQTAPAHFRTRHLNRAILLWQNSRLSVKNLYVRPRNLRMNNMNNKCGPTTLIFIVVLLTFKG